MIYAHLGLVDDMNLMVNYEMPVAKVFQYFAAKCILSTRSIEIFAHRKDNELENRRPGLATWAPDWTVWHANSRRQDNIFEDASLDNPHGHYHRHCYETFLFIRDNVLYSRGLGFSSVQTLSDTLDTTSVASSLPNTCLL